MNERDEDELWRSIVANYGDRAELVEDHPQPAPGTAPGPDVVVPALEAAPEPTTPEAEERFVPPPPPPVPRPDTKRLAAWIGVLGMPVLLLLLLLLDVSVSPPLVGYAMTVWFLGGFGYLVWQMPSGPRDPGDDGARL